ncbi:MAG: GNAT family N-acetyltransferase [Pseudomonadota bacterium]
MKLRTARPEDAQPCTQILREWIDETPWFPNLHSRASTVAFMAEKIDAGEVTISACSGGFIAADETYVSCLYVARAARGRGLGRALLDTAKARSRHLKLWTFQANQGAQRFYLREGFVEARRTDGAENDDNLPDIEYIWQAGGAT